MGWDPDETFVVPDGGRRAHERRRARRRRSRTTGGSGSRRGRRRSRPTARRWDAAWSRPDRAVDAARVRRRRGDRDARRRQDRDAGVQGRRADDDRRRGRPRRVDEDGVHRQRDLLRRLGRPQHRRSASASTRWARSSTGSACTAACVKPYGSTFLIFSDYMRPVGAALGAHEAAGRLGVDARLGRPRRGRPDAPAGRDIRGAARDPEPLVHAAGRRERDGVRVEGRRSSGRTGRSRCRSRARRCRRSTAPTSRPPTVSSAARTSSGTPPSRPTSILIGTGAQLGLALAAGREDRGGRDRGARRLDAVLGAVRGAAAGVPRRRCCRRT